MKLLPTLSTNIGNLLIFEMYANWTSSDEHYHLLHLAEGHNDSDLAGCVGFTSRAPWDDLRSLYLANFQLAWWCVRPASQELVHITVRSGISLQDGLRGRASHSRIWHLLCCKHEY